MKLVGINFMGLDAKSDPAVELSIRLDAKDPSKAVVTHASDSKLAAQTMEPITIGHDHDLKVMTEIAHENGIPLMFPPKGTLTFTPNDGIKFIIALLAYNRRGNAYSWVAPITE
jgi:hypothetical protein